MTRSDAATLPIDLQQPAPVPRPRRRFRKRFLLVLLFPAVMFAGAVMGMYFQPPALQGFYAVTGLQPGAGSRTPIALPPEIEMPRQIAETLLPSDVVGLARIMPRGDIAVVAAPYGAGDARVAEILISVGDTVARGETLARLDNAPALEGAVLQAEANLAVRQAILMQTRSAILASRAEAQASLDQARASAQEAASTLERTQALAERGVTTTATLDTARSRAGEAAQAVLRAEATLERFVALDIDEQPDVVIAARNVTATEAELARARMDLARAEVRAPISGTILNIHATPGQRPPNDGIMEMGDIGQMMAEVEIWQDRIAAISPGQPVEIVADALGRSLQGRVESVGLTVGRQGLISNDAAANSDARVIRVLVMLDAASSELAARYTNLEAVARIDTGARARAAQ